MNKNYITMPLLLGALIGTDAQGLTIDFYQRMSPLAYKMSECHSAYTAVISGNGLDTNFPMAVTANNNSNVLQNFVSSIVDNSESMPSEIAEMVRDNFWDLV